MKKYLRILLIPITLAIVNSIAFSAFLCDDLCDSIATGAFNVIRMIAICMGGWLIFRDYQNSLIAAGLSGIVVLFFDHVMLKGGQFLVAGVTGSIAIDDALLAFGGVVVSFMIFVPVVMVIAAAGGAAARFVLGRQRQSKLLP